VAESKQPPAEITGRVAAARARICLKVRTIVWFKIVQDYERMAGSAVHFICQARSTTARALSLYRGAAPIN
jgi:hypothetical protein